MEDVAEDSSGPQSLSPQSSRPSTDPQTPAEPPAPETAENAEGGAVTTEPEPGEEPADGGAVAEAVPAPGTSVEPVAESAPLPEPVAPAPEPEPEQSAGPSSEAGSQEAADTASARALGAGAEEACRESEDVRWEEGSQGSTDDEETAELEEWPEGVRKLQEQQLRTELLEQYRTLVMERGTYQRYNLYLQHKIQEALRTKKGLEVADVPDKAEPEAPEKEQVYLRYLATLEELKKLQADDLDWYHQELAQLQQQCQEKLAKVNKEWHAFQTLKRQVVLQAMGSCRLRGGRQAALREVEQIQTLENKKEKEMSAVRLENVQLKQSLVHFETRMRAQEDLTQGLLLIDFEQLKIENQTFNEKVEERNEELLKLRNKVTNNVQVVTHVKEKLHFVEMENMRKKSKLLELEAHVARKRDILTKTKQARDSLRLDNIRLNQKCGLLGKEALLQDMEEKVERTALLTQRLETMKRHHAGLALSRRGVKQKIREAKAFLPS